MPDTTPATSQSPTADDATGAAAPAAEFEEIGGTVSLGGADCETCGYTRDELDWYLDEGDIQLRASWGCYHSDGLRTRDVEEAVEFILDLRSAYPDAADALAQEAARLRQLVATTAAS